MTEGQAGYDEALRYPLFGAFFHRRSRRIAKGAKAVNAGSHSYTSTQEPQPLSALEEAVLIAVTGVTGSNLPDRPFEDEARKPILGTPNLSFTGRAAGSTDNSQATSFFLINDSGTYFLRKLTPAEVRPEAPATPEEMVRRAELAKVFNQFNALTRCTRNHYALARQRELRSGVDSIHVGAPLPRG